MLVLGVGRWFGGGLLLWLCEFVIVYGWIDCV